MTRSVEVFERLLTEEFRPLREAALEVDPTEARALSRLRELGPRALSDAALELAAGRRRSQVKFPERPELLADAEGVEQATSARVAAHKSRRFASWKGPVVDLCCGIGGDAMALNESHEVLGIDRDPVRAWMCHQNSGCRTLAMDVETWLEESDPAAAFHLDPSRRVERMGTGVRHRQHRFDDYQPSPEFMTRLIQKHPHGAIKLGPGVDLDGLPFTDSELELITDRGELVQCVAWFGGLAEDPGRRRATMLPDEESMVGDPYPPVPGSGELGPSLYRANAALERARLIGPLASSLALVEVSPGLGLLTGDSGVESPWLTEYPVVSTMPWRVKRIRKWLDEHDAGTVVVKTRGGAVDANRAARDLRGAGATRFVVFALRIGRRKIGVITSGV